MNALLAVDLIKSKIDVLRECHRLWLKVDNEDEEGENKEHADENKEHACMYHGLK